MPQAVLERVPVLRHVTSQGLRTDGKVDARSLTPKQGAQTRQVKGVEI